MKNVILVFSSIFLVRSVVFSESKQNLIDINFEQNGKSHQYIITKNSNKKTGFKISLTDERKKTKVLFISQQQVDSIKSDVTRIIWENQYRKPASSESCREYALLKTDLEKTRVCFENQAAIGMTYGFLKSLNSLFN